MEEATMKSYKDLVNDCLDAVHEIFPWDLAEEMQAGNHPLLIDIREPYEYEAMHIKDSINVPRGILESACDYGYEETVPELAAARDSDVVVICRSGYRSVLAAYTMQLMGYTNVRSLKTGLRGWNDDERPLLDNRGLQVELEDADHYFRSNVRSEQFKPEL